MAGIRMWCLALAVSAGAAWAQRAAAPNEEVVKPGINVEDEFVRKTGKMWVLDFKFKTPRTGPDPGTARTNAR